MKRSVIHSYNSKKRNMIKFIYLVVSDRLGIIVCSTPKIAESIKFDLSPLDPSVCVVKQILFTPEIY